MEVLRTNLALRAVRSPAVGFCQPDTDNARRVRARPWCSLQVRKDDRRSRNSQEWAFGFSFGAELPNARCKVLQLRRRRAYRVPRLPS